MGLDIACFCSNGHPYYLTLTLILKCATCTCEWGGGQLTLLYTKSYAYNNNIQENVIKQVYFRFILIPALYFIF